MAEDVHISVARALDDELREAVARLLPQLSSTAAFDPSGLEQLVSADGTHLFVARLDTTIVGMATLVTYRLPTGLRGHVDDVVVDEQARGKGLARALMTAVTAHAAELGVRTLDLTSRPSRQAAIALYESVGFRRRETVVMRYEPAQN